MKAIYRNFISVIRRFKLAVVLNVLGLSVAFAAFIVIMAQLSFDRGFDRFHADADRIFRMELFHENKGQTVINRPLAEQFFESSPAIVAGAIANPYTSDVFFHLDNDTSRRFFMENTCGVSPSFTDVFSFDIVEGAPNALNQPMTALIPQTMAQKMFENDESPIGKQLVSDLVGTVTIGAVYRDFPDNTLLTNCMYVPLSENENKENWNNWNYHTYIRVNDANVVPHLFDNFMTTEAGQQLKEQLGGSDAKNPDTYLRFVALPEIHFATDVVFDDTPKASRNTLAILFVIAIVIIVIAGINFTNFSTALTPMRVKSINTQKVLGARTSALRVAIIAEAVVVAAISYLVALLLVHLFQRSPLAAFVDADLTFAAHPVIFAGAALVALAAGILAGVYPAFYMTSFAPALVLKGSFGLSRKGKRLRSTLIGVQYIASFALIIGSAFMFLQNRFMQRSPLGYDKDALLTVNIAPIADKNDALTGELRSFAGIDNVTYGHFTLASSDSYMTWGRKYGDVNINFTCLPVHHTFLDVMGISVSQGRNFREGDLNAPDGAYIMNEAARQQYNLELGAKTYSNGTVFDIIGFIPDIKFASFRTAVTPMAFHVNGQTSWLKSFPNAYIRVKAGSDMRAAMQHIRASLARFDADYPFEVRYYDDVLQRLYEKEISITTLITLFSFIAIFIAIVGVFGLVVFDSECRRKEIGIRKVLGASTSGIILMFNKAYFRILLACFIIAVPLAWYIVHRWLENFAYKTPMHWWVYALALIVISIITAFTVTFQNWRVATANPVNAIKSE